MSRDEYSREIDINSVHYNVHNSNYYSISVQNTIAAAGTLALVITTGSKVVHFTSFVSANNTGILSFNEGGTITSGTAKTIFNQNRTSSKTCLSTAVQDPTISVAGTTLRTLIIGIGSRTGAEYNLNPNTKYTLIFTADNNSTNVSISAEFYEV